MTTEYKTIRHDLTEYATRSAASAGLKVGQQGYITTENVIAYKLSNSTMQYIGLSNADKAHYDALDATIGIRSGVRNNVAPTLTKGGAGNRTFTVTGEFQYWDTVNERNVEVDLTAASVTIPNETRLFFIYINGSGVLSYSYTMPDRVGTAPLYSTYYDATLGDERSTIALWHDSGTTPFQQDAFEESMGFHVDKGTFDLVTPTIGDTTIGITAGKLIDIEQMIQIPAITKGAGVFAKFYYNGTDAGGANRIYYAIGTPANVFATDTQAGIGTTTGKIIANYGAIGSKSVRALVAGEFSAAHLVVGRAVFGGPAYINIVVGQNIYASVALARTSVDAEVVAMENQSLSDAVKVLYSFILNSDGLMQDVGSGLTYFDWRRLPAGSGTSGFQPADSELTAYASAGSDANTITYHTGVGAAALTGFTPFARTLLEASNADDARNNIGAVMASGMLQDRLGQWGHITEWFAGTPVSLNLGASYESVREVCAYPDGVALIGAGEGGGDADIFRTTDFGVSVVKVLDTGGSVNRCITKGDGDTVAAGFGSSGGGKIQMSYDRGLTFGASITVDASNTNVMALFHVSGSTWLAGTLGATGYGDIWRTTDNWATYSKVYDGAQEGIVRFMRIPGKIIAFQGTGAGDGYTLESTDGGQNFSVGVRPSDTSIGTYSGVFLGNNVVLLGTNDAAGAADLYRSTDANASYSKIEVTSTGYATRALLNLGSGLVVCGVSVSAGNSYLIYSTNGGKSFDTLYTFNANATSITHITFSNGMIYVSTGGVSGYAILYTFSVRAIGVSEYPTVSRPDAKVTLPAATSAIANTETVAMSFVIPANFPAVGTKYSLDMSGLVTTVSPGTTVTYRIRLGGLGGSVVATVTASLNNGKTNEPVRQEGGFTFRAIGASGAVVGNISSGSNASGAQVNIAEYGVNNTNVTVDTTAAITVVVTAQSSSATTTYTGTEGDFSLVKGQ